LSIEIDRAVLENACKEMIETILICLPDATKGTIYRIGKPPVLTTERITSGIITRQTREISWGLPEKSGYNPPGRPWVEFRDEPGRPLEAMAWCVEKQKSWTSEDPKTDIRSVRLQVEGTTEDFHHMEPVLARKSDLRYDMYSELDYPLNYQGNRIWQDTDYAVVAVIKIHFHPNTIRIGGPETVVIKKLSRSLGTELLSHQLRQDSLRAMQRIARDRLNACNILADSLRNAITKSGLIYSLVKQEIGYLREQWEVLLQVERNEQNGKGKAIEELNRILENMPEKGEDLRKDLLAVQNRFLELSLTPEKAVHWVAIQIQERWRHFLDEFPQGEEQEKAVWESVERLKKSLYFGKDPDVVARYEKIPGELKKEWVDLIYNNGDQFDPVMLDALIKILGNPLIGIPSREKSKKTLIQLKALAENMNQLERNTNFLLRQVLNGSDYGKWGGSVNQMSLQHSSADNKSHQ
jgi:hypothetical protein